MEEKEKIKADLHVHTCFSADSKNDFKEIGKIAEEKGISKIAITDHNCIDGAKKFKELFPEMGIVGEEVLTLDGEIIGLFLEKFIDPYLPLEKAVFEIKNQGGLIYIPHPFDKFRRGIGRNMFRILEDIDIVEVFNGKTFNPKKNKKAKKFAKENNLLMGAGSDAHTNREIGNIYVKIPSFSNKQEFIESLKNAEIFGKRQKISSVLLSFLEFGKNKIFYGRKVR